MKIEAGRMITEAMERQKDTDFIRLVISEFAASGLRIQAKLEAAAAADPEWEDIAEYHRESMRQVFGDEDEQWRRPSLS